MKTVYAFAKFLGFEAGGAEASMRAILQEMSLKGHSIHVIKVARARILGNYHFKTWDLPPNYSSETVIPTIQLGKFAFTEALLNIPKIMLFFYRKDPQGVLYSYGIWGVMAALAFRGKSRYYVRAISDLGVIRNHHRGLGRLLKSLYIIIEFPGLLVFRSMLRQLAHKATIVANSKFIANEFYRRYGVVPEIEFPDIQSCDLLDRWSRVQRIPDDKKGVLFIGDSQIKGIELVTALIARNNLKSHLYIVGRFAKAPANSASVTYLPWSSDPVEVYRYAKLVIVPSICEEAFGRVASEAIALNIQVLVSRVGGLPEAVNEKEEHIVNNFNDVVEWEERINNILNALDVNKGSTTLA